MTPQERHIDRLYRSYVLTREAWHMSGKPKNGLYYEYLKARRMWRQAWGV